MDPASKLIRFRSVTEQRLAEELMAKEGQWNSEQQSFLTKEKQLQERSRMFQDLHQTLRFMPDLAYVEQGKNIDFVYPNCPKDLLRRHYTKHADLSEHDPSPGNVEKRQKVADDRKVEQSNLTLASSSAPLATQKEKELQIQSLESELLDAASCVVRPLSTTRSEYQPFAPPKKKQSSVVKRLSNAKAAASSLPLVDEESGEYSSLLMQLKRTKRAVESHHKELSTVQSILGMDASEELKRTITRMFADPKNADAISQDEFERREKAFEEDRKRNFSYQTNLLREERDVMERELAHFKM